MWKAASVFWLIILVLRYLYNCEWNELFSQTSGGISFFSPPDRCKFTGAVRLESLSPYCPNTLLLGSYTKSRPQHREIIAHGRCWYLANKWPGIPSIRKILVWFVINQKYSMTNRVNQLSLVYSYCWWATILNPTLGYKHKAYHEIASTGNSVFFGLSKVFHLFFCPSQRDS